MKRKNNILFISQLLTLILLQIKCANISSPSGGKSDTISPKIIKLVPLDRSTDFNGNKIRIIFSEPVTSQSFKQKATINPITGDYIVSQPSFNQVELTFNKKLNPNTTYTIHFNQSITDVTEKNPLQKESISFSTGPELDTNTIKGRVIDYLLNKPIEKSNIFLFDTEDSDLETPLYQTYSNEKGDFEFKNVPNKEFLVIASNLENKKFVKNKNQLVDYQIIKNEPCHLRLTNQSLSPIKIESIKNGKYLEIDYNKSDLKIDLHTKKDYNIVLNGRKYLIIPRKIEKDTIIISATDSLGTLKKDTFAFDPTKDIGDKPFINRMYLDDNKNLSIHFNYFTNILTIDSLKLKVNGEEIKAKFNDHDFLYLNLDLKNYKADTVELVAKPKSFFSTLGDTNKLEKYTWILPKTETTENSISGTLEIPFKRFFVQLYTDGKVIQEIANNKNFDFVNLRPGKYKIRVLIDENNNGVWDSGNILKRKKAEPIMHYPKEIELKENWEIKDIHIKWE